MTKYVKCVNNGGRVDDLFVGKCYEVVSETRTQYRVRGEKYVWEYHKDRFEAVCDTPVAPTAHKHADLIHAWADGAVIQMKSKHNGEWHDITSPTFDVGYVYRAKPVIDHEAVKRLRCQKTTLEHKIGQLHEQIRMIKQQLHSLTNH